MVKKKSLKRIKRSKRSLKGDLYLQRYRGKQNIVVKFSKRTNPARMFSNSVVAGFGAFNSIAHGDPLVLKEDKLGFYSIHRYKKRGK